MNTQEDETMQEDLPVNNRPTQMHWGKRIQKQASDGGQMSTNKQKYWKPVNGLFTNSTSLKQFFVFLFYSLNVLLKKNEWKNKVKIKRRGDITV